ncbi:guanylate cyclase [Candidatus Vecturithrix granuli]|uniref:Guanylate cyclase n=1 Tax=Vecturithrix granuli TaxID=1499967 RepID=A0A081C540_VECG1|nr:guanylate cyclase [Candidatus Vecturithrix granuli]
MSADAKTWDVFISYSMKDFDLIQRIVRDLQERRISYWLDEEQINPGDLILDAIEQGLRNSRAIMPCFSRNQLQSGWSRAEYSAILNQFLGGQTAQKIYPLLLDEITEDQLPALIRPVKCGRYTNQQSYARLLNVLCRTCQQPEIADVSVPEPEAPCIRRLLPQFIHDQYLQGNIEGSFEALTMFVDVSGFTKMTETLMQYGNEGAEVLAEIMNKVFALLVQAVYDQKGFISIFAGDAFTAIFPTEQEQSGETIILHGLACIEKIQDIFLHHGILKTRFGQFDLQFKVGLSYGKVNWGIVGNPQKTYFFRGDAIKACAEAEHQAKKGDIIFDERLAQRLAKIPGVAGSDWNIERIQTGAYRLHEIPQALRERLPVPQPVRERPLRREILAQFLPERVLVLKDVGEFRHIASVFIEFRGIALHEALNAWGSLLLEQIANYGGYLCQFDFSDKGNTVFCVFGAPVGLEDPIERALVCLLAVRSALKESASLAGLEFRAGVAYGMAYVGLVGGEQRCVYSFYSKVVNLSARLMARADWGEILVPSEIFTKTERFSFRKKGDFSYKGFAAEIPTYRLFRRKYGVRKRTFSETLVGRQRELRQLHNSVAPIFDGEFAGVFYVHGEAGIGKSHLTETLRQELTATHDVNWFLCPVDPIFRKPLNPFVAFLNAYFELSPELSEEHSKAQFEEVYHVLLETLDYLLTAPEKEITEDFPVFERERGESLRAELLRTKPVIGALLGLRWLGSVWEQLDAKGKHENTVNALKAFFLAHSLFRPTVIEIEDGHWIDEDSLNVLETLSRQIEHFPLVILSTLRYNDDGSKAGFDLKGIVEQALHLDYLSESDVKLHAEAELHGTVSDELQSLLIEKTKGNPFFVQQMIRYFQEQGMIAQQNQSWHLAQPPSMVPDSIQNIVIARLDHLSAEVKEAVKTAAVIGKEFEVKLLSAVLQRDLRENDPILREAQQAQIWQRLDQIREIFKHALFRDSAYNMQLKARRKELHLMTAEAIETLYSEKLEQYCADLALHYENAEIRDKAIEYLEKAGDQARAKYQNQQAIGLYDRLLAQLQHVVGSTEKIIDALLKKAEILELIGKWNECKQACEEALHLAEQSSDTSRMGQAKLQAGIIFRKKGQYEKAMEYFEDAKKLFEIINEQEGIARVFTAIGLMYWQTNKYEEAILSYSQALKIDETTGNQFGIVRNKNNIGAIYDMKGEYAEAMKWYQESLELCKQLPTETLEMSRILNNIGENRRLQHDYDEALRSYKKALKIKEELGEKSGMAIVHGNIGLVHTMQQKYKQALLDYDKAIPILRELGDKFYLCSCLIDKADALCSLQRYEEAEIFNVEGLQIVEEIGDQEYLAKGRKLSHKISPFLSNYKNKI